MGVTREDIKDLLISVKSFYPRFSLVDVDAYDNYVVRSQTLDSWYDMLGYKDLAECKKLLQDYISGPAGDKMPGVSLFTGRAAGSPIRSTARLENGRIRWEPEQGKVFELPVTWNKQAGAWMDEDSRLWAEPEVMQ